ncbi:hypothetical protein PHLGIDRAFT_129943 [Phlebiopsis gigantea 11061_1 CR5-6]|uniref:Cytochrome P450 n=1 Tax=Phlebiopsis gigantea (strain 11061_1 CR5-6) TaxID=745531 RepID=A0A0C3S5W3_PHLG1|nr:hypothetical protein PHLGIDRAFT_129943 [Phlebiopsis gigantea 11061_1 CR5-6]
MSNSLVLLALAAATGLLARWYYWYTHNSIRSLRGPPPKTWLLGNIRDYFYQESVGDLDFKYVNDFGTAWRQTSPLGANVLMLVDPKGLQHVMHKSGYNYPKSVQVRIGSFNVTGKSILWTRFGDSHSRHRKVMNPAFTAPQLRSFLPLFRRGAAKMSQKWKDEVLSQTPQGKTIAVNKWLARTTLDVIGEAAFEYDFGALDDNKNEVTKAYDNMFIDSVLHPPLWNTVFQALWPYLPDGLLEYARYIPTREYTRFRQTLKLINKVSKQLIDHKSGQSEDKSSRDVMSVLVRANSSENPKTKLSEVEMVSQMAALTLAGHETTANTVTWFLYELANHPEYQEKLREEITHKRAEINARGDQDFSMEDLESLEYLQAAIKETLRFHPIVYHLIREAGKDDVIPLSQPITTETGKVITDIPVGKGQHIMINVAAYNRLPNVWGEDAQVWNPMRFIDNKVDTEIRLGMFGNLMTFSAGVRGCIGWRFSIIELQAIIVELVENFKYNIPEEKPEIARIPAGIMGPVVKGKMYEGIQMPLHVTAL